MRTVPQAQVIAMKEMVSSLQESNKKKDLTIISMQARVDIVDENLPKHKKVVALPKTSW